MSKTHSLDIKTIYQTSLAVAILLSVVLVSINAWRLFKAFSTLPSQPSMRIREQQLQQAITLTNPKSPEN